MYSPNDQDDPTQDQERADICPGCQRPIPAREGAADDMPDHCDQCWAKAHETVATQDQETHPSLSEAIQARLLEIAQRKEREALAKRLEEERLAKEDMAFINALLDRIVADTGVWLTPGDLEHITATREGSGFYRLAWEVKDPASDNFGMVTFAHGGISRRALLDMDRPILWAATHPGWAAYQTSDLIAALVFAATSQS